MSQHQSSNTNQQTAESSAQSTPQRPIKTSRWLSVLEWLAEISGHLAAILLLIMVVTAAGVGLVLLGVKYQAALPAAVTDPLFYLARLGWLQELAQLLFSWVFLVGIAYTLKHQGHVRVDVWYARMRPRQKALIDLFGALLLLLPICIALAWLAYDRVWPSVQRWEGSNNSGGMPFWLFNIPILLMPVLLFVQALAEIVKAARGLLSPSSQAFFQASGHGQSHEQSHEQSTSSEVLGDLDD